MTINIVKIDKFLVEQLFKLKKQAIAKNQNILFSTMSEAIFSNGNFYKNINLITQNFNRFVLKNFQTINLDFLISSVGLKIALDQVIFIDIQHHIQLIS